MHGLEKFLTDEPNTREPKNWESFRHPELRYKNDTECFDDTGYVIFVHDIIKVTCYGGPNYYQVLPLKNGCFKIKQLDMTPDEIEYRGEGITDLEWLMCSYMSKVVIPKDSPELQQWLHRINQYPT